MHLTNRQFIENTFSKPTAVKMLFTCSSDGKSLSLSPESPSSHQGHHCRIKTLHEFFDKWSYSELAFHKNKAFEICEGPLIKLSDLRIRDVGR